MLRRLSFNFLYLYILCNKGAALCIAFIGRIIRTFLFFRVIGFPTRFNGNFLFQLVDNAVAGKGVVCFFIPVRFIRRTKQTIDCKTVNIPFGFRKSAYPLGSRFGNDCVVIVSVHSAVVYNPVIKVKSLCNEPVCPFRIFGNSRQTVNRADNAAFHILGDICAVRSRICYELLFVKALCGIKCLLCRVTVNLICFLLQ